MGLGLLKAILSFSRVAASAKNPECFGLSRFYGLSDLPRVFSDINQAIPSDKEIKSITRRQKIKLIESMNPDWQDLNQA